MKSKIAAAALAAFSTLAAASDQSVSFSGLSGGFLSAGSLFDGGDDVITFTGLHSGLYDFTLTWSGQYLDLSSAYLNGVAGTITSFGNWRFLGIEGTSHPDFVLTLNGHTLSDRGRYSGEISVSCVPEPQTYALMLAGLVAGVFMVRRQRRD